MLFFTIENFGIQIIVITFIFIAYEKLFLPKV